MRLYLDDNAASDLLTQLLQKAGHDVQVPADVGLAGVEDPVHLTRAIADARICLTKDRDDFWILHELIKQATGRHPGIFVVCEDNDPTRDLSPKGIVAAIRKLEVAKIQVADEFIILNHWR